MPQKHTGAEIATMLHEDMVKKVVEKKGTENEKSLGENCPLTIEYIKGDLQKVRIPQLLRSDKEAQLEQRAGFLTDLQEHLKNQPWKVEAIHNYGLYLDQAVIDESVRRELLLSGAWYVIGHCPSKEKDGWKWVQKQERRLNDMLTDTENLKKGLTDSGKKAPFWQGPLLKQEGKSIENERKNYREKEIEAYKEVNGQRMACIMDVIMRDPTARKGIEREHTKIWNPDYQHQLSAARENIKKPQINKDRALRISHSQKPEEEKKGWKYKMGRIFKKIGGLYGLAFTAIMTIGVFSLCFWGFGLGGGAAFLITGASVLAAHVVKFLVEDKIKDKFLINYHSKKEKEPLKERERAQEKEEQQPTQDPKRQQEQPQPPREQEQPTRKQEPVKDEEPQNKMRNDQKHTKKYKNKKEEERKPASGPQVQ